MNQSLLFVRGRGPKSSVRPEMFCVIHIFKDMSKHSPWSKETTQNYVYTVIVKKKRGIIGIAKSPELWGKHLVFSCPD